MWDALTSLYESSNENRKTLLRHKLRDTKMTKTKNASSYLTWISQVRDELGVVGEKLYDAELVRVALNGLSQPWHDFVRAVVSRENLLSWAKLWDDFTQEELRINSTSTGQKNTADEENVALSAKSKKKSKKDLSKVRCFACSQYGQFASQCPEKKNEEDMICCSFSRSRGLCEKIREGVLGVLPYF